MPGVRCCVIPDGGHYGQGSDPCHEGEDRQMKCGVNVLPWVKHGELQNCVRLTAELAHYSILTPNQT